MLEAFTPAPDPEIDCFYVYFTVSVDKGGNSDLLPNHEEARVIKARFARFGETCRTYAPIYRQVTIWAPPRRNPLGQKRTVKSIRLL